MTSSSLIEFLFLCLPFRAPKFLPQSIQYEQWRNSLCVAFFPLPDSGTDQECPFFVQCQTSQTQFVISDPDWRAYGTWAGGGVPTFLLALWTSLLHAHERCSHEQLSPCGFFLDPKVDVNEWRNRQQSKLTTWRRYRPKLFQSLCWAAKVLFFLFCS